MRRNWSTTHEPATMFPGVPESRLPDWRGACPAPCPADFTRDLLVEARCSEVSRSPRVLSSGMPYAAEGRPAVGISLASTAEGALLTASAAVTSPSAGTLGSLLQNCGSAVVLAMATRLPPGTAHGGESNGQSASRCQPNLLGAQDRLRSFAPDATGPKWPWR